MKQILLLLVFVACGLSLSAQSSSKSNFSVYPNPTVDYISVNDNNDQVGHLLVYNLVGKRVKEFDYIKGDQYFVADLPKGMYLVQIQDRGRKVLTTQKLEKR